MKNHRRHVQEKLERLRSLFQDNSSEKIVIGCRTDDGDFFGGELLKHTEEEMLIRNRLEREESVPQDKLTWLEYHQIVRSRQLVVAA